MFLYKLNGVLMILSEVPSQYRHKPTPLKPADGEVAPERFAVIETLEYGIAYLESWVLD
jgi:hypothetical protein